MKNKALIVALSEFTTLVRSKGFLVGLVLMPVFMAIAFGMQRFTRNATDINDRIFVVVDRSGALFGPLKAAADDWNRATVPATGDTQTQPRYFPTEATFGSGDDEARARLSDRVRRGEIFAFVEIPADALNPDTKSTVSYHSNHPGYRPLPSWIATALNREIVSQRFRTASIDRAVVVRLTRRVEVSELGLLARDSSGGLIEAVTDEEILAAHRVLSAEVGIFVEPASASGVAGLLRLSDEGRVPAGARIVVTVTGHGLKDPQWALRTPDGGDVVPVRISSDVVSIATALGLD